MTVAFSRYFHINIFVIYTGNENVQNCVSLPSGVSEQTHENLHRDYAKVLFFSFLRKMIICIQHSSSVSPLMEIKTIYQTANLLGKKTTKNNSKPTNIHTD